MGCLATQLCSGPLSATPLCFKIKGKSLKQTTAATTSRNPRGSRPQLRPTLPWEPHWWFSEALWPVSEGPTPAHTSNQHDGYSPLLSLSQHTMDAWRYQRPVFIRPKPRNPRRLTQICPVITVTESSYDGAVRSYGRGGSRPVGPMRPRPSARTR